METFEDKLRAWAYAFGVHILVVAALLLGLLIARKDPPPMPLPPGPVIEADLVGLTAAPRPPPRASRPKPVPPTPPKAEQAPTPTPPEPKPQPPSQQTPDQVTKEKVVDIAQEKAEQADKAEKQRIKNEQVLLQQEEQKARERQKEMEKVKKEVEAAKKQKELEQEKLKQLEDYQKAQQKTKTVAANVPTAEKAVTGMNGTDNSLTAQYYAAIQKAITDNWLRPETTPPGLRCNVLIAQIPGGEVIGVQVTSPCNADAATRTSLEQAVKRAAPLPYKGYESVFTRNINFNFTYDG